MNAVAILKLYFAMNGLLLASLTLFLAGRHLLALTRFAVPARTLARVTLLAVGFSVGGPLALRCVPQNQLPRLEWGFFRANKESGQRRRPLAHRSSARETLGAGDAGGKPQSGFSALAWAKRPEQAARLALLLLALGVAVLAARFFLNLGRLVGLTSACTRIRSLGQVVVGVSEAVTIPFSARIGRLHWVVLPAQVLGNGRDLRLIVRHELQHHRAHDTTWAIVAELFVCLFFPNPAAHWWKRELNEIQEFSCDEALVGRRGVSLHEYGSCLVRVAEAALGSRRVYAGTTCMAAVSRNPIYLKSFLRRRIEMLTKPKLARASRWGGIVMGTITIFCTIGIAWGAEQAFRPEGTGKVNGGHVVVDPAIQRIAETILDRELARQKASSGFVIVGEPSSGRVLAVANIDTSNQRRGYWSLGDQFEPASTFKSLVVAEAIEEGRTSPEERLFCENGSYRYGDRVYHDWKQGGFGYLSTTETIGVSSDICSIKIAEKIGADGLVRMLGSMGFGPGGTASTFPEAQPGVLPPAEVPEHPRTVPYIAEGAGIEVSPLEMVQAYGAIANGGTLLMPLPANAKPNELVPVRRIFSPETAAKVTRILEQVVTTGTGHPNAESALYTTAGKTGTSSYPRSMPFDVASDFAHFIGFAPARNPRVVVYVTIRDPKNLEGGAHGSGNAAPVFRQVVDGVLAYLKVAPDKGAPAR